MSMQKIEALLARTIGLDPASLGATVLRRAVDRRAAALGLLDVSRYASALEKTPGEIQELIEAVVVGESWFLRHPQSFSLLAQHANETLQGRPVGPYRAASVPSAGGEEPYSILLSLVREGIPAERVAIDAVDVSAVGLEKARRAIYGERALRAVGPEWRERFFMQTAAGTQVRPELRDRVQFYQANILQDAPLPLAGPYDAVFCRNLLIYLTPGARERVLGRLDQLLGPRGILFLGHAERLEALEGRFHRLDHQGAFAYRRAADRGIADGSGSTGVVPKPAAASARPHARNAEAPKNRVPRGQKPERPKSEPRDVDLLEQAQTEANARRYERALELCKQHQKRKGPTAESFQLMGTIYQAQGHLEEARRAFERAVYLEPHLEPSLLGLSLLAQRRGDAAAAKRFAERARRASAKDEGKRGDHRR